MKDVEWTSRALRKHYRQMFTRLRSDMATECCAVVRLVHSTSFIVCRAAGAAVRFTHPTSLRDTKVTAEAVADLKKSLPKCQVFHK
jgi:hypothetical protein